MYKKIIKFDDTAIEEVKFHHHKCANVLLRYMIKKKNLHERKFLVFLSKNNISTSNID